MLRQIGTADSKGCERPNGEHRILGARVAGRRNVPAGRDPSRPRTTRSSVVGVISAEAARTRNGPSDEACPATDLTRSVDEFVDKACWLRDFSRHRIALAQHA